MIEVWYIAGFTFGVLTGIGIASLYWYMRFKPLIGFLNASKWPCDCDGYEKLGKGDTK